MAASINLSESTKKTLLRIISLVMLMEMLDATVLNTALPQIAISLHVNPIKLKEILTIYFLSLGIFIPVSGWVADRFGEKNAILFAIALFTGSSIGCGVSVNLPMLVIFRLLQGIGGAFLMPVGRQIMVRVFPGIERMRAMVKVNVTTLLALSMGPLIGGALTTYVNWRWIFFVNIPGGLLAYYLTYRCLPAIREREHIQFDFRGFIIIAIFLGTLLFLLDIVVDSDVVLGVKLLLLLIVVISLCVYIWHAKRFPAPLISLNLFKHDQFRAASLGSFLTRLAMTSHPFLVPLLLQAGYGYTAMQAGLLTVPVIIGILTGMSVMSKLATHFNRKKAMVVYAALMIVVFSSFYWQAVTLIIPLLIFQQFVIGFIMPLQTGLMNNQAYEDLTGIYISQGTSFYSGIIQVSGSFGIALAALVMTAVMGSSDLQHHIPLSAFKVVFIVQTIYLILALWVFVRNEKKNWLNLHHSSTD